METRMTQIPLNASRRTALLGAASAAGLAAASLPTTASAQAAWPNRPIKWIVPYPPGGQTDIVSRYLAEKLSTRLLYPSDAAHDLTRVDLGGRRVFLKKQFNRNIYSS